MNIVFRVNANNVVGSGHFFRSFLLAQSLKKKNKIFFITNYLKKEYKRKLTDNNFFHFEIKKKIKNINDDVKRTLGFISRVNGQVDLLIVDSYDLNFYWESKILRHVKKLMVIDDKHRNHYCNYYLNSSILKVRVNNFFPKFCKFLIGYKYAILNPTNLKYSKNSSNINTNRVKNILIFMGASDRKNFTLSLAKFFKKKIFSNINFYFVIGINNNNKKKLITIINKQKNYKFFFNLNSLSSIISKCNFAITNGGQVIWELIYQKKPNIILCLKTYKNEIVRRFKQNFNIKILRLKNKKINNISLNRLSEYILYPNKHFWDKDKNNYLTIDGRGLIRIKKILLN